MIWFLTFISMLACDVCWSKYTLNAAAKRAHAAAFWSVGIMLTGAFAVLGYTHDQWLLIPAASGAWIGTFLTVRGER